MNYTGMYRSNEVQISDVDGLREEVLDATVQPEVSDDPEDAVPKYIIDGQTHIDEEHDAPTLWLGSTATTFDVWDEEGMDNVTEQFLEELSEFITEPLVIRSVGYEGLRYMPDAFQYIVTPDGDVTLEQLDE